MLKFIIMISVLLLSNQTVAEGSDALNTVDKVLNQYHQAAANANFTDYFSTLHENTIILGTDGNERWTKDSFKAFVQPYFSQGRGWKYQVVKRNTTIIKQGELAFFDEQLTNASYGDCRGSGVVMNTPQGWKILQYNLTVVVPNEIADDVVSTIQRYRKDVNELKK
ncbi:MAG: nuclear transport factor 2 family protein [Thalassotalea sp.]